MGKLHGTENGKWKIKRPLLLLLLHAHINAWYSGTIVGSVAVPGDEMVGIFRGREILMQRKLTNPVRYFCFHITRKQPKQPALAFEIQVSPDVLGLQLGKRTARLH